MEVKSFDFREEKKNLMKDVCKQEGFGMLKEKKKQRNGQHVDLGKEVNSILVNNEEEKDVDGLEEKQIKVLMGIEINNNNNNE